MIPERKQMHQALSLRLSQFIAIAWKGGTEEFPGELSKLKVWGNQTLGENSRKERAAQKEKTLVQKEICRGFS